MARPAGGWRPDGRAAALARDCDASLEALGRPIDLYLIHAPDPRVKWATTVRALGRLLDAGRVRAVGVSNVNLAQLDEALSIAPISAVQVAFSLLDDAPERSGVWARCRERALTLLAHSPLGGPRRARRLLGSAAIAELSARLGASPAAVALAALLEAREGAIALPGVRSPEGVRQVAEARTLSLSEADRERLAADFRGARHLASPARARAAAPDRELVLIMGLPGAGKSEEAGALVTQGYQRLNRDEEGGSLAALSVRLEALLAGAARRVVVDGTYVTRAMRADVLTVAARCGVPVRGVFIDVSTADAQVNVVLRMLEAHGRLLTPEELRRGRDNTAMAPTSLWRVQRALEPPTAPEGFASLQLRAFSRRKGAGRTTAPLVAADVVERVPAELLREAFVIGWAPRGSEEIARALDGRCREVLLCPHGGGPPVCWCRPPLPGLPLALAHAHQLALTRCELYGRSRAHEALAAAVGARFVSCD